MQILFFAVYKGHQYQYITEYLTWDEAFERCPEVLPGSHLATVFDEEENNFIYTTGIVGFVPSDPQWLGARRVLDDDDRFSWIVGSGNKSTERFGLGEKNAEGRAGDPDNPGNNDCRANTECLKNIVWKIDEATDQNWATWDKSTLPYTKETKPCCLWAKLEPSIIEKATGDKEDCLQMGLEVGGGIGWNDASCNKKRTFTCKRPSKCLVLIIVWHSIYLSSREHSCNFRYPIAKHVSILFFLCCILKDYTLSCPTQYNAQAELLA